METSTNTICSVKGSYSLSLEPGSYTLEIAFIGYQTQRITSVVVTLNYMKKYIYMLLMAISVAAVTSSCKKESDLRTLPFFGKIDLKSMSLDQSRIYSVQLDGKHLEDSLKIVNSSTFRTYELKGGKQRLVITSAKIKQVVLDTLIELPKNPKVIIVSITDKPSVIIRSSDEQLGTKRNIAFFYDRSRKGAFGQDQSAMPDEISLEIVG